MQLNTVVLPAPFGPMIAVMSPRPTLKRQIVDGDQPAEAHGQMLDGQDRVGFPAIHPRPSPTSSAPNRLRPPLEGDRRLAGRDQAARPPDHDQHHRHADDQHPVFLQLAQHLEGGVEEDHGDDDAELAAEAAEHDDREDDEGFDRGEALGRDEALAGGEERAGEAAEHGADGKGGELGVGRVDAERAAGDLVLAQRFPGATDRQPAQAQRDEIGDQGEDRG